MKVRTKSNLTSVLNKLDEIEDKMRFVAAQTVLKYGEMAKSDLKDEITRQDIIDTGRLRRSVEADYIGKNRVRVTSEAIDPRNKVDYAPFQEYGTRHIHARPYFYKTVRRVAKKLRKFIQKLAKRTIR